MSFSDLMISTVFHALLIAIVLVALDTLAYLVEEVINAFRFND